MRTALMILLVGGGIWLYTVYLWQPLLFHHWVNQAIFMLKQLG